ncbi:formyl transferase [Ornithobacterium rhinotracheale]|uniref:formyl transferase n=1 Tax=Ornithobacterium rhinotracheale TaxID=28251 RepID=UPI003FD4A886
MSERIVILAGENDSTKFIYNSLKSSYNIEGVILEKNSNKSKKKLIKGRIKKLGIITVLGQLLFQIFIVKFLSFKSNSTVNKLKKTYDLDSSPIDKNKVFEVNSINSNKSLKKIKELSPDLIIVNGTRIISSKILDAFNVPFINIHAGINPKYRGVHGAYWALANDDLKNCGVTVHLVDKGVDTGGVLKQKTFIPNKDDNFTTYFYHQIGLGIPLLRECIDSFFNNRLSTQKSITQESKQWYHPTAWFYIWNYLMGIAK